MKLLLLLSCFFISTICWTQAISVSGTILDEQTNKVIPGVTVAELGTNLGTISNDDGFFLLEVSGENAILSIQYLGYATQKVKINGRNDVNVALMPASTELNEIVVTALGLERSTKDLGYATQNLDSKEIAGVKSPNFVDQLGGQIAGLSVSQGATGVGSSTKITIRGESSFTNNNPLFVVDGTPINNQSQINFTNDAAAGFQEIDFGNGAMEINADEVASVNVLKGPSAAALYGTRASNGVILITTKDGSEEVGFGIEFNSTNYIDQPFQLPQFQNKFGQGNSGQFEFVDGLGGGINDNITYSWGPSFKGNPNIAQFDSPVTLPNGQIVRGGDVAVHGGAPITPSPFEAHPDNLKNFYKTGTTNINNLAFSSGFSNGHFRLSLTDMRSESYIPGVNLKRKTGSARLNFQPLTGLKIRSSINYINSGSDNRPANGYGSENINYSLVAWGPRSLNTESLKNYWQPGLEGSQQYSFNYTFFDNPYFILQENRNSFDRDRLFGNISLTYQLNDQWDVTLRSGLDNSDEGRKFRRGFSSNRFKNGAFATQNVFQREINTDFLLHHNSSIGILDVDVSVGGNRMDRTGSITQTQALSLAVPGIFKLSNGASPLEVFDFETQKRINSLYGIAKLNLKNTIFIDITGRNDWSSALATPNSIENTSFFYPSVSGSLIVSNLSDLPELISFAKIRASWAAVGNDTDPFQTSGVFLAQTPVSGQPTFSDQNTIANQNLLPERTQSFEIGGDVRLLDDKIKIDVTYYNSITKNQIISLPIAISTGYNQQVINGGEVASKGIEIVAGITPIRNRNFTWTSSFNFSKNRSIVTDLPNGVETLTLAYSRVYDNVNQTVWYQVTEGGEVGDIFGTGYLKNDNGDFVLDGNGKYIVNNDLIKLGNYNPDFMLGFANDFNYKNWNINFLFDWRKGGQIVSRTLALAAVGGQLIETENRPSEGIIADGVVNIGSVDNPMYEQNSTAVTAEQYYRQFYDRNHEENNVYNASFLKLRSFSIGYTFENKNAGKGLFKNGRKLSINLIGRNLFATSAIPHFDPEQLAVQGQNFVSGVEDMSYPSARSIGIKLGINL